MVLAGACAGPNPAAADRRARAVDRVVGMAFVALGTVGDDLDVGPDRQGTQLALEAVFVAGDISDGRHVRSPQTRPRTVRGDGQTVGMAGAPARIRRAEAGAEDRGGGVVRYERRRVGERVWRAGRFTWRPDR